MSVAAEFDMFKQGAKIATCLWPMIVEHNNVSWTYLQSSLFVRTNETHKIKEQLKPFFLSSSLSYTHYLQWIILLIYGMLRAWTIVGR